MKIAINTRFLLPDALHGYGIFIHEIFSRLAAEHPGHEFFFIFDQPVDEQFITARNIVPVVAGPKAKYPLLWKYWYDIKLPAILKKIKADVFVSFDGFCSLKTAVPQCLLVQDLAMFQPQTFTKRSHTAYLRKYTPRFVKKADTVMSTSAYIKQQLISTCQADPVRVDIVYGAARDIFQPLDTDKKMAVQNNYTDGKAYFLYAGTIQAGARLIELLKAFSLFKKRQQSTMKLVIAGAIDENYTTFKKELQSYKYREDVVLVNFLDAAELARITASAYGFVNASLQEIFPMAALEAMQAEVPVVMFETGTAKEILGEAALYAGSQTHTDLAEKMMLVYKDERLRNDLIIKGKKQAAGFSWDTAARLTWQGILKAIS